MARIRDRQSGRARTLLQVVKLLGITLFLYGCTTSSSHGQFASKKKKKHETFTKKDQAKLKTHRMPAFSFATLFGSKAHRVKATCPNYLKSEKNVKLTDIKPELEVNNGIPQKRAASLLVKTDIMEFDIMELGENKLDIPEFKQFKNNRSEFTANGNEQFDKIITQLKDYLGDNTLGEGLTLRIRGSASQIPTSYHPKKENFGINLDGSSIKGQTNVKNNVYLAHARAMQLAYSIKKVYPLIQVLTPEFEDIELGATQWNQKTQKALDKAHIAGDRAGKELVFEPFQKEQFVIVESKDLFVKTIKPNAIKTYTVAAVPRLKFNQDGEEVEIKGQLIISERTFQLLKNSHLKFQNTDDREVFMQENNLKVVQVDDRWHLVSNGNEEKALRINDLNKRLAELYKLNMNHDADYLHITELVKKHHLQNNKYKYIIKSAGMTSYND